MRLPSALLLAVGLVAVGLTAGCSPRAVAEHVTAPPAVSAAPPVIYEVFVRSVTPEGTLRAATTRLDSIRALGVDVVWLMPIHPVGERDRKGRLGSPYAVRDYRGVDPALGTLADVRAFTARAHALGMRVILDWVANHTAADHPWVDAHPEWYTAAPDGSRPTPPAGTDWTDVADLDYSQPALHDAMTAEMAFWVREAGIDGFRCDVAEMVPLAFWQRTIPALRQAGATFMLAEGSTPELHAAGFDATYSWTTYRALLDVWRGASPDSLAAAVEAEERDYPAGALRMHFATNHDETSWDDAAVTLWGGPAGLRAALTVAFTLPGAPMLYNGVEASAPQRLNLFEDETVSYDGPSHRAWIARLAALRREVPALVAGRTVFHDVPGAIAYSRAAGGTRAFVVVNPTASPRTVALPAAAAGLTDAATGAASPARLALAPHEARVYTGR